VRVEGHRRSVRRGGAEDCAERVAALARELGVSDRLAMVGLRTDVENVYGAADLVAVPSTAPGDASAMARVAAALLGDPLIRGQLGTAAADDVRTRFAPELLTDRIGVLYAAVLATRR
jgi:hypothetical protein